jgi:transcriptional regulator with XRE-family HTH domain
LERKNEELQMLAEALRLIRVFHDVKQNELAAHLQISKSHLSEIESGKKQPSLDLIERYSEHFGMPKSSIIFFAENLANPSGSMDRVDSTRDLIARKVINFLKIIEDRTADAEKV